MRKATPVFIHSLFITLLLLLVSGSAFAQATRTWVSGVGNDADPCSRTAPCKTFQGTIAKTAAGGQINCLDPGGFGGVTITKSITISCKHVEGSVLVGSTNAIVVNGANIVVVLRGIDLIAPVTIPGLNGVNFINGASLTIEDCTIRYFAVAPGYGVLVQHTAGLATLRIFDTQFTSNGVGDGPTGGAAIGILPSGSADVDVFIRNSNITGGANGIQADSTSTTGSIDMTISDTVIASTDNYGVSLVAPSKPVRVTLDHVFSINNDVGVRVNGAWGIARLANSLVTGNNAGVQSASGGVIQSYGTNRVNANTVDGTMTPIAQK